MNTVPALGLVFDPTHESGDVIDQRASNDPTRAQTGGATPVVVTPGDAQPIVDNSTPQVSILSGWNIWDVYQAQTPIDPLPGSLNDQLAAWVRDAAQLPAGTPVALVSNIAAGQVLVTRSSFPSLDQPLALGVDGTPISKRTVGFQNVSDRRVVPWPHDMNMILDAAYIPAPAPVLPTPSSAPVPTPSTSPPAMPVPVKENGDESVMVACGLGLLLLVMLSRRGRRS